MTARESLAAYSLIALAHSIFAPPEFPEGAVLESLSDQESEAVELDRR